MTYRALLMIVPYDYLALQVWHYVLAHALQILVYVRCELGFKGLHLLLSIHQVPLHVRHTAQKLYNLVRTAVVGKLGVLNILAESIIYTIRNVELSRGGYGRVAVGKVR